MPEKVSKKVIVVSRIDSWNDYYFFWARRLNLGVSNLIMIVVTVVVIQVIRDAQTVASNSKNLRDPG